MGNGFLFKAAASLRHRQRSSGGGLVWDAVQTDGVAVDTRANVHDGRRERRFAAGRGCRRRCAVHVRRRSACWGPVRTWPAGNRPASPPRSIAIALPRAPCLRRVDSFLRPARKASHSSTACQLPPTLLVFSNNKLSTIERLAAFEF
jgi:hypothetical protein